MTAAVRVLQEPDDSLLLIWTVCVPIDMSDAAIAAFANERYPSPRRWRVYGKAMLCFCAQPSRPDRTRKHRQLALAPRRRGD